MRATGDADGHTPIIDADVHNVVLGVEASSPI